MWIWTHLKNSLCKVYRLFPNQFRQGEIDSVQINGGRLEMSLITQECYGAKLLLHFKKKTVVSKKDPYHDLGAYFGLNSESFSCWKEKSVLFFFKPIFVINVWFMVE